MGRVQVTSAPGDPDPCQMGSNSHMARLLEKAVNRNVTELTFPVHSYMEQIYMMMKEADEREEILQETGAIKDSQVKGFISVAQDLHKNSAHMLFNMSGLRRTERENSKVKVVLTKQIGLHRRRFSRLLLNITLDIGTNSTSVSKSVKWSNATGTDRMEFDITRYLHKIRNNSQQVPCGFIRLSLQIINKHRKRHPKAISFGQVFQTETSASQDGVLLAFYYNIKQFALLPRQKTGRQKRSAFAYASGGMCGVRPFTFAFKAIDYSDDFVIAPKNYSLNYCSGECPSPLQSHGYGLTYYAYLKDKYHIYTNYDTTYLPRVCCSPNEYARMSIFFRNVDEGSYDTVNLANMIVKSCQCL